VKRPKAQPKVNGKQATLSPGIPRVSRSRSRQSSALKQVGNATRSHTTDGMRKGALASHSSSASRPQSVPKSSKSRGASLGKKNAHNPTATFSPGTTRQSRGGATISSTIQNPFYQSNNQGGMNRSNTSRGVLNNNESLSLSKTISSQSIKAG
jgi:hypothetical protein